MDGVGGGGGMYLAEVSIKNLRSNSTHHTGELSKEMKKKNSKIVSTGGRMFENCFLKLILKNYGQVRGRDILL
jgi:hypothetical protein